MLDGVIRAVGAAEDAHLRGRVAGRRRLEAERRWELVVVVVLPRRLVFLVQFGGGRACVTSDEIDVVNERVLVLPDV
eukprot:8989153-Pyramimonas_sp.AAC.1